MGKQEFRADLEGLRGVAVALVVLFHAQLLGAVGGFIGVDAFYVLSGFLITGLLLRELTATGRVDLVAFYGRRARRILPAATVAIIVILAAAAFIVAPLDLPTVALDATASGLFFGNVLFAIRATDYFGTATPSPFLHYWSLGVEEQFYLVWPLLLLLAFRARKLAAVLLGVCVGSLALSIALTSSDAPWAFYGLPTRAWQLALGGLIAVHGSKLARIPSPRRALGGWIGLELVILAAVSLDSAAGYPGFAAILPTAGVALLIVSGGRQGGPTRLLSIAPLRALGRISFSLYLYHWPVLVLASTLLGDLTPAIRWALVALAVVIATVSWRAIEVPFHRARLLLRAPKRALALGAGTMCVAVIAAQLVGLFGASTVAASNAVPPDPVSLPAAHAMPGAAPSPYAPPASPIGGPAASVAPQATALPTAPPTLVPLDPSAPRELRPRIGDARNDADRLNERGCGLSLAGTKPPLCVLGDGDGRVTVALVGDSHAAQWFPALQAIAVERGWRILPFTKDSCIFVDMPIVSLHLDREYTECARWRENVVSALKKARPDLIIASSSRWLHPVKAVDASYARQADAMVRLLRPLADHFVVIADTPLSAVDVPACLSRRDRTVDGCASSRSYALTAHLARDGRVAEHLGAVLFDPSEWLCDEDSCPAVIDWTVVYRDDHHLTATMVRRMAPLLEPALLRALDSPAAQASPGAGG
jgi:peptidoglycan/LPS O-acetylase OafA/YrhL